MDKVFYLPVRATVKEMAADAKVTAAINNVIEKANRARAEEAAVSPVGPNHKPRMLQLTAWICHAGKPNLNDKAFLAEDLREAVEQGLFQAPYFGMIDFNHDFEAYGCWYDTEFAFDPEAQEWGIIAHGALFAWRYTELADKVLAMQARQGYVDVSMACMAESYEPAVTEDGRPYLIIRRPVFFTTSVLDVDPADVHARGVGSENPDESPEERTRKLTTASLNGDANNSEEGQMEELIKLIEAKFGEQMEELRPLVEAAQKLPGLEDELASIKEEKAALEAKVAELESEKAALGQAKAEAENAKATAEVALDVARKELESAQAKIEELEAFKREIEEKEAAEAEEARRQARMTRIPEAVLAALENDENKDALIEMWMSQSDEAFEATVKLFSVALNGRTSMVERSSREGKLSTAADTPEGGPEWAAIRRWKK